MARYRKLGSTPSNPFKQRWTGGDWVYLIRFDGDTRYKIGCTKHPKSRIAALQADNQSDYSELYLIPTNSKLDGERYLHYQYGASRLDREWFDLSSEQVSEIKMIKAIKFSREDGFEVSYK